MTAVVNGIQYIGGQYSPNEFIHNKAATIDGKQKIESAVSNTASSVDIVTSYIDTISS